MPEKETTIMGIRLFFAVWLLWFCSGSYAQAQPAPLQPYELEYFHFMLMRVGNLHDTTKDLERHQAAIVAHFGLNSQEAATLRSAASEFRSGLQSLRQTVNNVTDGKSQLTDADRRLLETVTQQQKALVDNVTKRFLASLSPPVAAALRNSALQTKR